MKNKMAKSLARITENGTKVVSFKYHGKPRNVMIGTTEASRFVPPWAIQKSPSVVKDTASQKHYLVGTENNLPTGRETKIFSMSKIRCPSF